MSMLQQHSSPIPNDEYLRRERNAEVRHEYLDGRVFAMAGESGAHADISANIVGLIGNQLKGRHCRVRTTATKVRSEPDRPLGSSTQGLHSKPDVVVICGELVYHERHLTAARSLFACTAGIPACKNTSSFPRTRRWWKSTIARMRRHGR